MLKTLVSALIKPGSAASIDCRADLAAVDTPDAVLPKAHIRLLTVDVKADTNEVIVEETALANALVIPPAAAERAVSN